MFTMNSKATSAKFDTVYFIGESNTINGIAVGDTIFQGAIQHLVKFQAIRSTVFPQFI